MVETFEQRLERVEELGEIVDDDWRDREGKITGIVRGMKEKRGNTGNAGRGWWYGECIGKKREVRRELSEWQKRGKEGDVFPRIRPVLEGRWGQLTMYILSII